jgi:phosphoribosyl-ATP pyrophosphohydrolase/phosphoribosyl-AMP cyclohydrolase
MESPELVFDERGLVPAIVQDVNTGRVLMLAYVNRQALEATRRTGQAHFWSRSREELWHKGETSGNTMEVLRMRADCDGDALLMEVKPSGPACHTGAATCFSGPGEAEACGFAALERLAAVIAERAESRAEGSYTVQLLEGGVDAVARKVIEEAAETALAAKSHASGEADDLRLAEEAADLLYHLLVLLAERGVSPRKMLEVLADRARPG